jgi:hypothetical protein
MLVIDPAVTSPWQLAVYFGRLFVLAVLASAARGAKAMLYSTCTAAHSGCSADASALGNLGSAHDPANGTTVVIPCYNCGSIRGSRMCPCQTRPARTPLSWSSVHSRPYRCRELMQQSDRIHFQWQQQENHSPLPCMRIGAERGPQSFSLSRPRQFYRAESYTWRQSRPNPSVSAGIPWSARRRLPRPRSRLP